MDQAARQFLSVGVLVAGVLGGCQPAQRSSSLNQGQAPAMPPSVPRALVAPTHSDGWAANVAEDPRQPRYSPAAIGLFGQLPPSVAATPGAAGGIEGSAQANLDNLRQMTFASEGDDFDPAIDPTGKFIVFASTRHRPTPDLYLQAVNGSAVTRLTDDPAWDTMPTFSPDGKRIAFCSNRSGNMDIYMMGLDGSQPVQITHDPAHDIHPSFSPDGRMLVYSTQSLSSGQWELVVVDLERPGQKHYLGPGLFPHWSPVDNKIVFQRARQRGTRWFSVWTIDFVNGEGLHPTELAASANAACLTPHWSPDGKFIVFCTVMHPAETGGNDAHPKPAQADIWVMNADGSGRVNLTNNAQVNTQPVWARDGQIYFVSSASRFASENIWSLRPDRALTTLRKSEPLTMTPGIQDQFSSERSTPTTTVLPTTSTQPSLTPTIAAPTVAAQAPMQPPTAPTKMPAAMVAVEDLPRSAASPGFVQPMTPVVADEEHDGAGPGATRSVQVSDSFNP